MIHRHGPLSSTYLHAFSRHLRRNRKRALDRLTDLFHEDNTPHGGPYLDRPWQQFKTFDARYQDLVYALTPAAESALKERDLWSEYVTAPSGPWLHRYMVACVTASIELATLATRNLVYIPQEHILERAKTMLRYPVPFENPTTGKVEIRDLIPDALFGLEYKSANGSRFRFFVVEADRGTEPSRASNFNRKSHLRHLLQYRTYIGRRLYQKHLKLSAGLLVLNVMTTDQAQSRFINLTEEVSLRGNSYQLFQTCDAFGQVFTPPKPLSHLLHGDWRRAGMVPFRIDRV